MKTENVRNTFHNWREFNKSMDKISRLAFVIWIDAALVLTQGLSKRVSSPSVYRSVRCRESPRVLALIIHGSQWAQSPDCRVRFITLSCLRFSQCFSTLLALNKMQLIRLWSPWYVHYVLFLSLSLNISILREVTKEISSPIVTLEKAPSKEIRIALEWRPECHMYSNAWW